MSLRDLPPYPLSRWLLVRGLPRDSRAAPHLTAMLVAAVATVLLVRGFLAAAGYPRIGGGGLHIAHVLWGGLLMLIGLILLLSFAGPVIRPLAAVASGIGAGLFIDEIGKFVTSDNNYFYRPATAIMYVVIVCLVLVVHLLHGKLPHHPSEHLAAAVDQAVAGVVGGFTPARRAEIQIQLRQAAGAHGLAETRALIHAVPDDPVELFDPLRRVNLHRLARRLRRGAARHDRLARQLPLVTALVLLAQIGYAGTQFGMRLYGRLSHPVDLWRHAPGPIPLTLGLASTVLCTMLVAVGVRQLLAGTRHRALTWFHRALLVNLLFTRVFQFDVEQFLATVSVLVDVVMLVVVGARLSRTGMKLPKGASDQIPTAEAG
jgi:hypothetical protein